MHTKHWRRLRLNRWILAGVTAVLVYALLGFLLAPRLIKHYVSKYAREKLTRNASMVEVRVNPFLFTVDARGFMLEEADHSPIMGFERMFIDLELSSLFRWAWTFADIRIERPLMYVEIPQDGCLNLAALSESLPQSTAPPPQDGRPPRLLVQHAQIMDGRFTFSDRSHPTPASETFAPLNIEFKNISTLRERKGPYTIVANLPGGGTVSWSGEISLRPVFSQGRLSVSGFKLATAWKFAQDELKLVEPAGEMDFSTRYGFHSQQHNASLTLEDATLALKGLVLTEKGKQVPILDLKAIEIAGMDFDLHSREMTVSNILVRDGNIAASVNQEGIFNWQKLVVRRQAKDAAAPVAGVSASTGPPWRLTAEAVTVENVAVEYTDHSRATPLTLGVGGLNILLNASAEIGAGPADVLVDGLKVKMNRVAFSKTGDTIPLIAADTLALDHGHLTVSDHVKYGSGKSGPKVRASGSVNLDSLRLNDTDTGDRCFECRAMSINGLTFGWAPNGLHIKEIKVVAPGAKIVISKDRSVNLARIIKDAKITGAGEPSHPAPAPAAVPRENPESFPVTIDRVRVEKGAVDFADLSLVLPFASNITGFNGGVTGISSDPLSRASVAFTGNVGEYGLATVQGSLSPFMPKSFMDITVSFRNVEMKPLTPYSATFAGRSIASGTLNLDLGYKIQNSELLGDNKVVLEQFTLGERVEAPHAVNLPLDLAIALLTDARGKIDVAVPVQGNVDNPEFKYGHVIRQAFINLITKIVTSPFRMIGGLMGGKGEKMDAISFYPGSDRLLPPALKKLKTVVEALKKRPRLKLVVQGRFDPRLDGEALRTHRVKRALAVEMDMTLAPDEEFGPIGFENAKTQQALETLLEKQGGDKAVAHFKTQYEKNTGDKVQRVNTALAFFGKASPDTAFYQAMFKELVTLEPVTDTDLLDLAQRRAQAIVTHFNTTSGLDITRVSLGNVGPVDKSSLDMVNTRLSLDVIKPSA